MMNTSFWNVKWRGKRCFRLKYPRLYSISNQREARVGEVGVVSEVGRVWLFSWRRHLFVWEEELLVSLMEDLEGMRWYNREDEWRWNLEELGVFSIKLAYGYLMGLVEPEDSWNIEEERMFVRLWKSPAPSKVVAFAWKVLLNCVPTKANLALRNVLTPGTTSLCVLCNGSGETTNHLFLHCHMVSMVWSRLMIWLDWYFLTPPNLFVHWECWSRRGGDKNRLTGLWLIWQATIWVVWKARNYKIFKGSNYEIGEIVEDIKVLS
ncbi:putative reverse transcriptase zinc-binding domain-containing protein [Medicago truncatula]|uniref:Putative reverse transcriptase zinc-binding domain-containing protein n=1 Tax=Medicago truncatula TaxID=3880 RepID=A0A396J3Y3_MEDTR|nr:putative reverse transcriptase zinc-binding domain-containing protein [Medicago truncatula]